MNWRGASLQDCTYPGHRRKMHLPAPSTTLHVPPTTLTPAHARLRNVVLHLCVPGSPIFGWIINLRWRVQRGGETTCSFAQVVPPISYPNKRKGGGGYGSCFTALQQLRRALGDA